MRGLSLVVASGGHFSLRCVGLSLSRPLLLRSTGSRRTGSVIVAHGPSCSAACGIFPEHGSNPCRLHWQADSQPLRRQGSPSFLLNDLCKHLQWYNVTVKACGYLSNCFHFRDVDISVILNWYVSPHYPGSKGMFAWILRIMMALSHWDLINRKSCLSQVSLHKCFHINVR